MEHQDQTSPLPTRATWRFLKAYVTTFLVVGSYLWLAFKSRFFGRNFYEERIFDLHKRNAARIEETILKLQGLFIKVGQLFSIMTNFLPHELRLGLENLQDAVPERPYTQIERRVREELGGPPDEVFATFNKEPEASASLGQVHFATTKDGAKVAVKVQHWGVGAMVRSDLKTIKRILGIVKLFLNVRGLDNYYREIRSMILEELDFALEATHIEQIAANFKDNEKVRFPRVIAQYSTTRVLTLEYVDGIKITDVAQLEQAGLQPAQVVQDLVTAYCQMIFVDGIYHADPHPGNILVQPSGRIVLLDFGAIGYLSSSMRQGISAFFEAIIKADEKQMLRSLREMGFLQVGSDQSEAASRVIEHFHRKFQDEIRLDNFSLSSIKVDARRGMESLADLREMNVSFRELSAAFHMPKEWVLLERTVLLLAGLCTHLDPHMNPAQTIRPYLEDFVLDKDQDWSEMLFDLAREKLMAFLALPSQIDRFINRSLEGKTSIRVTGITAAAQLLYAASHQLIYTFLSIASAGVSLYFYHVGDAEMTRYTGYASASCIFLLIVSMIRARRFRRKL